ncbi:hypothetical protein J2T10_000765 [Paenarthrobacter nicotinovorans]|uniref:Uncharacterized protein n=1 Tax=Paenarthrobacter nicotinovorans TaxID=29320 RepID=A0ABT9THL6_PAENI|nr:hypothetical protein [Paenarthrobacter nicotinovorans]MDQ0101146.1 hypothetical protein [Paenarthrobacter nicotinovorans]
MTTRTQLEAALTLADQTITGLQATVKDRKRTMVNDFRSGLIRGHAFTGISTFCGELAQHEAMLDIAQQARDQLHAQLEAFDAGRLDAKGHG